MQNFMDSKALAIENQLNRTMLTTNAAAKAVPHQIMSWLGHLILGLITPPVLHRISDKIYQPYL